MKIALVDSYWCWVEPRTTDFVFDVLMVICQRELGELKYIKDTRSVCGKNRNRVQLKSWPWKVSLLLLLSYIFIVNSSNGAAALHIRQLSRFLGSS